MPKLDGEVVPASKVKAQDLLDRMGVVLVPLENFRVEPNFPLRRAKMFSLYLDGFLIRRLACDCPAQTLLASGCQCGGV